MLLTVVALPACVTPVVSEPRGAPRVPSNSDLERAIATELRLAREELLTDRPCLRRSVGWCGSRSSRVALFVTDGFRWKKTAFDDHGRLLGQEEGGCTGRWSVKGAMSACSAPRELVSRELCSEVLGGLQRRGSAFRSRCLGNTVERIVPVGRTELDVLAEEGALRLAIEVPASPTEPISMSIADVSADLEVQSVDESSAQPKWEPRRRNDALSTTFTITNAGARELCSAVPTSLFELVDAGVAPP